MFSRKKNKPSKAAAQEAVKTTARKNTSGVPSIISADLRMLGNIISDGVVDIDGIVEGNVRCQTATIRRNGHIKGDVVAESVHVYGKVQGLIKARNVHFFKGCRAEGVITHESITIEDGAFVDGRFKRTDKVDLDEVDAAFAAPASEPKLDTAPLSATRRLFGADTPAAAEDAEFTTPSFMLPETESEPEDESAPSKGKAKKRESVLDNLRLISDVNG